MQKIRTSKFESIISWLAPSFLVILALITEIQLRGLLGDRRYLLLFPAIFFGTLFGHRGATVIATIVATVGTWLFLIPPAGTASSHGAYEFVGPSIFFVSGILASVLSSKTFLAAALPRERKRAEQDYKELAAKFQKQAEIFNTALSSSPDFHYVLDTDHRFIYVNETLLNLWGKKLSEAVGKNFKELGYPDHLVALHKEQLDKVLKGKTVRGENEFQAPDGTVGYYEYIFEPVFTSDGRVQAISGTTRDATARHKAEEKKLQQQRDDFLFDQMRESESQFRTFAESIPQLAWIARPDGFIFWYNQRWYDYTGTTPSQMEGWGWQRVHHPDVLPLVMERWTGAIKSGTPFEMNFPLKSKDGEYRTFLTRVNPVRDSNGHIVRWFGTNTDIEELERVRSDLRAAKEEAERANTLKSSFLANMSHEIRTPLGAMIGFADLLRDRGLSEAERANYIDILVRNGENLTVIINDILDLSKVEAGHLVMEFRDASPDQIAGEVVSLLRVKAKEKGLSLVLENEATTPSAIVTDAVRLKQVLMNVVGNAIKFTQFGSVRIRTFGCKTETGKNAVCFEVKDTGIGVPESQKERVFEMFVQADGSMARRFGGTGLGLALSRRLARALGGDVEITKSVPREGTTFLITIEDQPEFKNKEATDAREARSIEVKSDALAGLSVLVVDDSPDNQQLIWHYLTKRGAHVEAAENGLVGYQKALAGNYDIILMDIQMPEMDGYTATHKLRSAGYNKPIVALTAHVMSDVRQKCLNVGCSGHLAKPINAKQLIATIAELTEQ